MMDRTEPILFQKYLPWHPFPQKSMEIFQLLWGLREAALSDWLMLAYSILADEVACCTRLPDSISQFSCHLGWAVNANKLLKMVWKTWCCCLWGVLVHIHTTNKSLMWANPCTADAVLYKLNFLCVPVYLFIYFLKVLIFCDWSDNKTLWCTEVELVWAVTSEPSFIKLRGDNRSR